MKMYDFTLKWLPNETRNDFVHKVENNLARRGLSYQEADSYVWNAMNSEYGLYNPTPDTYVDMSTDQWGRGVFHFEMETDND